MAGIYADTSALGRLILGEVDAAVIRAVLDRFENWRSSVLLVVELRRLGIRAGLKVEAEQLLATVVLEPLTTGLLDHASRLEPAEVRALDAIHLATAIKLRDAGSVDAVLTYDGQLQAGCAQHGIPVEAPVV